MKLFQGIFTAIFCWIPIVIVWAVVARCAG